MNLGAYAELDERPPLQGLDAMRWKALEAAARRLEESRERLSTQGSGFFKDVRQVVLVASSSRSGSSLFVELLSRSSKFLHFPGEINPFLRLAGLSWPDSGSTSDRLVPEMCNDEAIGRLQAYFALEVGAPAATSEGNSRGNDFDESLYRRLCLQWPLEVFTPEEVSAARATAAAAVEHILGRKCNWAIDLQLFHALFLKSIRVDHLAVNPYYYDLDRALIKNLFPELDVPVGPPSPIVIEEPPFILTRPWRQWQPVDLAERILVIKTPSNAYRLELWRALFPSARFRVLHLTRNPAASINGIYDGWHHWGFHSHYVGAELRIPGYSELQSPDRGWWKFDLPPEWQNYKSAALEQICAFQWSSAQTSILEFVRRANVDYQRIRFENILSGNESRLRVYQDLCDWLGSADDELLDALSQPLPPVMATKAPRQRRWQDNADVLGRVINEPTVRGLAETLDYKDESEWI